MVLGKKPDWLTDRVPSAAWESQSRVREFILYLLNKFNLDPYPNGCYQLLAKKHICAAKGSGLHIKYGSVVEIMRFGFPEKSWYEWMFDRVPRNFWRKLENRQQYLKWLEVTLSFESPDDWYEVKGSDFSDNHGGGLFMNYYGDSPQIAVKELYPEHEFYPWKFRATTQGFWQDKSNHLAYIDWLYELLGFKEIEDWYGVTKVHFHDNNGGGLLNNFYGDSPSKILKMKYPDFDWKIFKFKQTTKKFWANPENTLDYLNWLFEKLELSSMEDWYAVDNHDYAENYGLGLTLYYSREKKAISDIVIDHFPEYKWKKWLFSKISDGWWHDKANRREYCDWLFKKLHFEKTEDWYMIMQSDFNNNQGGSMLVSTMKLYTKISEVVMDIYPEYDWDVSKFGDGKKNQQRLFHILKLLFPDDEIKYDYKHPDLRFSTSNRPMELDVFLPERNLAFEYQGQQHYEEFWQSNSTMPMDGEWKDISRRDGEKRVACKENGIRLIEVPYTWNATEDYIRSLIEN